MAGEALCMAGINVVSCRSFGGSEGRRDLRSLRADRRVGAEYPTFACAGGNWELHVVAEVMIASNACPYSVGVVNDCHY